MQIKWQDKTYDFEPARDLTVSRLRHIKSWYPATSQFERGLTSYLRFIQAYGEGDVDALACVMWVIKTKAGEPCPEPMAMDNFNAGEFWAAIGDAVGEEIERLRAEAEAAVAVDPTVAPVEGPSKPEIPAPAVSTAIPTPSAASTSASSPTSATSAPETLTTAGGSTS